MLVSKIRNDLCYLVNNVSISKSCMQCLLRGTSFSSCFYMLLFRPLEMHCFLHIVQ